MSTRLLESPVLLKDHRGVVYGDQYGTFVACENCGVVTKRKRNTDRAAMARSFRRLHTLAAKVPPYTPRHASPASS